jgi:hypothetical protein
LSRHRDRGAHALRRRREIVTHHARGAAIGTRQRREHAHERRLPRAVRPEDRENHAAWHVEIDAIHGAQVAEVLGETARMDGQ